MLVKELIAINDRIMTESLENRRMIVSMLAQAVEASANEPDEGSTVREATAALEALRKLDKVSRKMVINQIRQDEWVDLNG